MEMLARKIARWDGRSGLKIENEAMWHTDRFQRMARLEVKNVSFFLTAVEFVRMRNAKFFRHISYLLSHSAAFDAGIALVVVMPTLFGWANNFSEFHRPS